MYESSCPAPGTIGSVKGEHAASPAVVTDRALHRLIFLDGGFGKLLSEFQNGLKFWRSGFDKLCHDFLSKAVGFEPVVGEPLFHLLDGVWIIKCCHIFHGSSQF